MGIIGHHGNSFLSFGVAPVGEIGGWVELGRTTLGATGDTISTAGLPDKRYYMVLTHCLPSGVIGNRVRFNNDAAANYARRNSFNGSESTSTSDNQGHIYSNNNGANDEFDVFYIANVSTKEKLAVGWGASRNTAGAGTATTRSESVFKWANTSSAINRIDEVNLEVGDFAINSQQIVLGWDPADTHTTNFWDPLVDVDLSAGEADTLSSGVFTSKKYLWIQAFVAGTSGSEASFRVGNTTLDTGSNYVERFSSNGAPDVTSVSQTSFENFGTSNPIFYNIFIINNASEEKLLITHMARQGTAGADNVPARVETVGKWVNTANQIDILGFDNVASGNFGKNSYLKVWGSN